jgi:ribosomal protein S20
VLIAVAGFFSTNGAGPQVLVGAGIMGLLWTIVFKVVPKTSENVVLIKRAANVIVGDDDQPDIGTRVGSIEAQIKPKNGEGTIREGVNRLEKAVTTAKSVAEEAKAAADQVAAELILSNEQAARERARLSQELKEGRGLITVLLNTLDDFAATNHQKEIAYIRALKALGIDLTEVADRLEDGITDET